jgi:hypothetical protein
MYDSTRNFCDNTLDDGNGNLGEAYEGCWVRTRAAYVIDEGTGFDWWLISDTGADADSLEIDPVTTLTYVPTLGDINIVEGWMDFYYDRQIAPLGDGYVVTGLVDVDDRVPMVEKAGGFTMMAPNPFNPMIEIRFLMTKENLAQLNIYDIRGQLVRSLVSDRLPAQEHVYFWDGTDASGHGVASGTYIARLRIGSEVLQVRQMQLVQ